MMQRRHGELALALLLGAAAVWLWSSKLIAPAISGPLVDYGKHYDSAPLTLANMWSVGVAEGYYYPTFQALLHQFLFWFDKGESAVVWSCMNLVLVIAGSLVLADLIRNTSVASGKETFPDHARRFVHQHSVVVVLLVVAAFEPLQRVLRSGNVDPLNFFLASMVLALIATKRDWRAGIIIGFFCLVKIVPVLLIPPLIVLRKWRILAAMGGLLAAYAIWLLATGWWRQEAFLFREILPEVPWIWQHISLSVHRTVATLFLPAVLETPQSYARLILLINVVMGLSYCGLLALAWRRGIAHGDLLMAAGLVTILAFSPLLETIHFSWILPAFAVQARAWIGGRVSDLAFVLLLVGWMALSAADTISAMLSLEWVGLESWMLQTALYLYLVGVSLWVGTMSKNPKEHE